MDTVFKNQWNPKVLAAYNAATIPTPGYATGYRPVPIEWSPGAWLRSWTAQALTINFAHQTRAGMAQWLSATRALYDVPGLTTSQKSKALFQITLDRLSFDPNYASGIPHSATWAALAAAGTTWTASNITSMPTTFWGKLVAVGWQSTDQRMGIYNVTGTLTSTTNGVSTAHTFKVAVAIGSAFWQQGYGTSYFSNWSES
jgi:hypothetical protein